MKIFRLIVAAALFALASGRLGAAEAEATAYALIKEGNKHVGEEAKDRIVQLRSEKSIGSVYPNIWFVVFFDPDATAKATEVKFGAGKKLSVKRPARILEFTSGSHRELNREKMKIDSDKAIETALKEPMLNNIKVSNTQLWLERMGWWTDDTPIWRVRLWAPKLRNPEKTADIGEVFINAADGKVVKTDLKINRLD